MTHPSRVKGNRFERSIVKSARIMGLEARRAYGSNGQSLGESETVDLIIENIRVQAKIRKKLGIIVRPAADVDVQIIREFRGKTFVVAELELFLHWLTLIKAYQQLIKGDTGKLI